MSGGEIIAAVAAGVSVLAFAAGFVRVVVRAELESIRRELKGDHRRLWAKLDSVESKVDTVAGELEAFTRGR